MRESGNLEIYQLWNIFFFVKMNFGNVNIRKLYFYMENIEYNYLSLHKFI